MKIKIYHSLLLLTVLISGCEKAIDLKLDTTNPQYVVEGILTNEAGGARVLLSQTKSFTDNNSFVGVAGAQVSISSNNIVYQMTPNGAGTYQNTTLAGTPGATYQLTVAVNGKTFTAASTMPQAIALDSIYLVKDRLSNNADGTTRRYAVVKFKDAPVVKNYYRFVQYVGTRKDATVFVDNDEFTDGQAVTTQLYYNNDNDDPAADIRPGNKVTVEMLCIDAAVYKYWFSLISSSSGDGNNAAPANPLSNIQGGALGYFSAHTISRKTITAP